MNLAFRITQTPVSRPDLPASLAVNPRRSAWLNWCPDGTVEIRSGKVEIGQGILTALGQIAAHELRLPIGRIRMIPVQTGLSPMKQSRREASRFRSQGPRSGSSAQNCASA